VLVNGEADDAECQVDHKARPLPALRAQASAMLACDFPRGLRSDTPADLGVLPPGGAQQVRAPTRHDHETRRPIDHTAGPQPGDASFPSWLKLVPPSSGADGFEGGADVSG